MVRNRSHLLIALLALASFAGGTLAQGVPSEVQQARSKTLALDACLQDAANLARDRTLAQVRSALGDGVRIDDAGRAHVELVSPEGFPALPRGFVTRLGGVADTSWRNRLDARVPLGSLLELAGSLPLGHRVVRASAGEPDDVVGQGPAAIGTDTYHSGGVAGAGLTIAVIDGGYTNLSQARANGDAPTLGNSTLVNYTPGGFEADSHHGTGCVEAAFDHCPGATWRLYKIDSLADMGTAVSDAIANGVDVITHSLSRYNLGWADDTGGACTAATQAAGAGIPFFTSAGNRAEQHWQGTFNAGTGSATRHDWAAGDEGLAIQVPAFSGAGFYLSWNTAAGSADYDLYLYDAAMTSLLNSSTAGGSNFEYFYWGNGSGSTRTVNLVVEKYEGAVLEFEVFGHGGGTWEHFVSAGSTTSPSNTTNASVISVGAVDWSDFPSGKGATGILTSYSSRGPSNSGMTLPDLVGPTNTTGFTYPASIGGFGGTSCATPNAAGAACTYWSSVPAFSGNAARWLVLEQSRLHRDWGANGADNLYGQGGASLAAFAPNTVWLARGYGNTLNLTTGPYYTLNAAYTAVPTSGRILALPGTYPEHPVPLTQAHRIESYEGSALFGN